MVFAILHKLVATSSVVVEYVFSLSGDLVIPSDRNPIRFSNTLPSLMSIDIVVVEI